LGWIRHRQGQGSEALALFPQAEPVLAEHPNGMEYADRYNNLGNIYYGLGEYQKVRDRLKKVCLRPGGDMIHFRRPTPGTTWEM